MTVVLYIILFSVLASLGAVAVAGGILVLPDRVRVWIVPRLISYALGTLLGAALLGMLPHALDHLPTRTVMMTLLAGILAFFVLEKLVIWRHCHDQDCPAHAASGVIILVGDAFHNFVDGLVIASAFMTSVPLGVAASMAVIAHEIPQEAGDFGILLHIGYSRRKAFLLNSLSASTTIAGAVLGYFGIMALQSAAPYILCISAASFLYIALADLIPIRREQQRIGQSAIELMLILAGIATIVLQGSH